MKYIVKYLALTISVLLVGASCQPAPVATNVSTNTSNTNQASVTNTNTTVVEGQTDLIQLNTPYSTKVYDISYASSYLGNLEILQNGETQTMYTQVFTPLYQSAVSFDRTAIFIGRYQQHEGLEEEYNIVNPETGEAHVLSNQPCLQGQGYWQGNTLITYGNQYPDEAGRLATDLCFWNTNGELLGSTNQELYWSAAASAPYLSDAVGIVPLPNVEQFWIYTEAEPGKCILTRYQYDGLPVASETIPDAAQTAEPTLPTCKPAQFKFELAEAEGGLHATPRFLEGLQDPIDALGFVGE